jgi:hypothetical protein
MRNVIPRATLAPGLLAAGLLLAGGPALAIGPPTAPRPVPDVTYPIVSQVTLSPEAVRQAGLGQIEVYDGPRRTVHYVAPGLSPGERSSLRDLARAENDAAYADDLLALKRRYVDSELLLEPYRRSVQQMLFGYNKESTSGLFGGGGYGGGFFPYAFANPYANGFSGGFGSYFGGGTTSVSHTLATGVGYEGPLKDAMARTIASEATPEFSAATARGVDAAMGRAASSERLAKGLGVAKSEVTPAGATTTRVILTLKSGDKVEGTPYGEDAEWFKVETSNGVVSVRKSDVTRVEERKK